MNLATLAGQASHYSAVRARLMGTMPEARAVRLSRIRANIAAMPNVSLFKW